MRGTGANPRGWLLWGGAGTSAASLLHLAIVLGGPDWYRFFGAGERMARAAARGRYAPALIAIGIATVLAMWALYAFSGAGLIRRLPFLRATLATVATVFLTRGVLGVPFVLLVDDPYVSELRARMAFMVVTSVVCVGLGVCYAAGAILVTPPCGRSRSKRDPR